MEYPCQTAGVPYSVSVCQGGIMEALILKSKLNEGNKSFSTGPGIELGASEVSCELCPSISIQCLVSYKGTHVKNNNNLLQIWVILISQ